MPMPPVRRASTLVAALPLVAALALLAACGSPPPTATPTPTPTPTRSAGATSGDGAQSPTTDRTQHPTPTPIPVDEWPLAEIEDVPGAGFGGAFAQAIVAGGPGLVAVGSVSPCCADVAYDDEPWSAIVWTSRDGRRWELLPDLASFGRAGLLDAAVDDHGQMLAVGYEVLPPDTARPQEQLQREMRLWRSTNGTDWFSVPAPQGEAQSLAWVEGEWVIGGASGSPGGYAMVWTSANLDAWRAEDLGVGSIAEVTGSDDGTLVATGVFESSDGSLPVTEALTRAPGGEWSRSELDGSVHDLVWHPALGFVAVGLGEALGAAHATSWSSADGVTWHASELTGSDLASIDTVAVAGDLLLGVASPTDEDEATAALWSSDGGTSWTLVGHLETPPGTGPVEVRAAAFRDAQYSLLGSRFLDDGRRVRAWHGP